MKLRIKGWTVALAAFGCAAGPVSAQTYARITGPSSATDGATINVIWVGTSIPPASLVQNGVRAQGSATIGTTPWTSALGATVAYTAGSTAIALNFRNPAPFTLTFVLTANGAAISPPYAVTINPAPQTSTPTTAPQTAGNPAFASAACKWVLGVDCMASGNPYASLGTYLVAPGNAATFSTQATMQAYIMNYVGANPGAKSAVIQAAAAGTAVCTEAATALANAFTANPSNTTQGLWNSYGQLAPVIQGLLHTECAAPVKPTASYVPAAQLQAAYLAVWGAAWASPPLSMANCPTASGAASCARSALANYISTKGASALNTLIPPVFTQVLGFAPSSAQITTLVSVFGRNWSGADDLNTYLSGTMASWPNSALTMIANSYLSDFGRQETAKEIAYWASVKPSDPRLASRAAFLANDIAYLEANQAEREATIQRAYQATWNVTLAVTSPEMKFWEPLVTAGKYIYSQIKNVNDVFKAANPAYVPSQPLTAKLNRPASYTLQSTDGPASPDPTTDLYNYLVNLLAPLPAIPATAPAPPDLPRPQGVSGAPATANNPATQWSVFNNPLVIAATYSGDPTKSFCLATGSSAINSPVIAEPCNGRAAELFNVDQYDRIVALVNPNGLLCLDGGDKPWPTDPTHKVVILTACSDSPNQKWYWNTISGLREGATSVNSYWGQGANFASSGQIQNKGNTFCLNIDGANPNNASSNVISYPCTQVKPGTPGTIRPWNEVWGAGNVMTTGAAYLFLRFNPPFNSGHVGWGIQLGDGTWEGGAWDGPESFVPNSNVIVGIVQVGVNNNAWRHHFATETDLRNFFLLGECTDNTSNGNPYDQYYRVQLTSPSGTAVVNTAAVFSLESQGQDWGYGGLGNNCMNIAYKILLAYGWNLASPDSAPATLAPRDWFTKVGNSASLGQPYWLHGTPWDNSSPMTSARTLLKIPSTTSLQGCWGGPAQ